MLRDMEKSYTVDSSHKGHSFALQSWKGLAREGKCCRDSNCFKLPSLLATLHSAVSLPTKKTYAQQSYIPNLYVQKSLRK
jgi:hypothetical protein